MPAGRYTVEAVFKMVNKVSAPTTRMAADVNRATRRMGEGFRNMQARAQRAGRSASSALGVVGLAGSLMLARAALGDLITTGASFQQSITAASARFGPEAAKGTAMFEALTAAAREAGASTEFKATEAAEGLDFMARAGFKANQAIALLPMMIDLATASGSDLARSTDIATDALGAFALMTKDPIQLQKNFARVTDAMSRTVNSANLDMEQFYETMSEGAPSFLTAGGTMEQFMALTQSLAGAGIKGSKAGTALKNIGLKLADSNVQKQLADMGVKVADAGGELRSVFDIIADLQTARKGKTGLATADILNKLFGLRGVTGVSTFLKSAEGSLREMHASILGATGDTARLAKIMRDTLGGEIKQLNSAGESLQLTLFDANEGPLRSTIKRLTGMVREVDALAAKYPERVRAGAGVGVAIVAVLGVAAIFGAIAFVVTAILGSTTALVAAAVAGGAAFFAWLSTLESVQKVVTSIKSSFSDLTALNGGNAPGGLLQTGALLGDYARARFKSLAGFDMSPEEQQAVYGNKSALSPVGGTATLRIEGAPAGSEVTGFMGGFNIQLDEPSGDL